jgi:hypothetical protein
MAIGSNFFGEAKYAEGGDGARHIQRAGYFITVVLDG